MTLRTRILEAVQEGRLDDLEETISKEPRAVRYLVGLIYRPDKDLQKIAAQGIALASRYHPKLVKSVAQRLVWAMKGDSGHNATAAPEVLYAISQERPDLLLPVLADLVHLGADTSLYQRLCDTLRAVKDACPGELSKGLGEALNKRIKQGDRCGISSR